MIRCNQMEEYIEKSASMIFLCMDLNGLIIHANTSAKNLLSIEPGTTCFADLPVPFTAHKHLADITCDGSERYLFSLQTHTLPVSFWMRFYAEGEQITAYGELDYDEIQKMEKVIVETNQGLSNLARELEQKRIKLDQTITERNQLLGIVAHDLRTPIGNIIGMTKLFKEELAEILDPDNAEILDLVLSQSIYMQTMLEQLLDLSAIECGELKLYKELLFLNDVLEYVCALHKQQCERKCISLHMDYSSTIPAIYGDRGKLIQVFSNLISNALKFSSSNTAITICANEDKNDVHIMVTDQGPGIAEDEKLRMFQPFSQLSPQPTAGEKSTGLGLAIVHKVIQAHQGRIEVESVVGQGTTMHVYLPVHTTAGTGEKS